MLHDTWAQEINYEVTGAPSCHVTACITTEKHWYSHTLPPYFQPYAKLQFNVMCGGWHPREAVGMDHSQKRLEKEVTDTAPSKSIFRTQGT